MRTRRGGESLPFLEAVIRTIETHRMLSSGDRILVGVSGGPDSTALLHVLADLRERYRASLHAAHLHHGVRGEEADRDAEFVRKTAESLGIPLILERIDVAEAARRDRLSLQAGARKVRYEFFRRAAEGAGCSRIALGHTADDQAETVLMRFLRGAGSRGLGGIPPVRGPVIRPLIELRREEILAYLTGGGHPWVEDSSNLRPVSLRNRIRLELIPRLKREYNPNLVPLLAGISGILRDEDRMLDDYAAGLLSGVTVWEGVDGILLDAGRLGVLPVPIQRRIVRLVGERLCGRPSPWSLQQTEAVTALVRGGTGPKGWTLPGGIRAERLPEGVWLRREGEAPAAGFSVEVPLSGEVEVDPPGIRVETRIVEGPVQTTGEEYPFIARFDPENFSAPIRIRSRREGDAFSPRGMGGRRQKLKKFFIDRKIPRDQRDGIPILVSPEGILWVVGWRTDERFAATEKSRRVLEVRITPAAENKTG